MSSSPIDRNLVFMLTRAVGEVNVQSTLGMLQTTFPDVKDFTAMRVLAKAFVANECKPLKQVPAPSVIDPDKLSEELKSRLVNGSFALGDNEALIVSGDTARGPYERTAAKAIALKMSAASPTNDPSGFILDPETAKPSQASLLPESF